MAPVLQNVFTIATLLSGVTVSVASTSILSRSDHALRIRKLDQGNNNRQQHHVHRHDAYGSTHLTNLNDLDYVAEIEIDGTPVQVIVDTGSSDFWVVKKGFQCLSNEGEPVPASECQFGPPYDGGYQYGQIPNVNFNESLGTSSFFIGTLGKSDVTIAGLTAWNQTFALVDKAQWMGDNVTSGILGMAYPSLTDEFQGTNPQDDDMDKMIEYDPVFTTLCKQKTIPPVFGMALERNSNAGWLSFGGAPPAVPSSDFINLGIPQIKGQRSEYDIAVDGYYYNVNGEWIETRVGVNSTTFLDSGTTVAQLPDALVKQLATMFDPPATYYADFAGYITDCNATAPRFGVKIAGHVFEISPKDLVLDYPSQKVPGTNQCLVGLYPSGGYSTVLGTVFMNNVVAVFDVGQEEIWLAQHDY